MKKILLLSISSLAMLMADFTLTGEKLTLLTLETAEETTSSVQNDTGNTPGIIPNSVDLIWADMHELSTGYPAAETKSRKQYIGGVYSSGLSNLRLPGAEKINAWYELLEGTDKETGAPGTIKGCQLTGLKSTNSMVELSRMVLYWMDKSGVWHKMLDKSRSLNVHTLPTSGIYQDPQRGCNIASVQQIRDDWKGYDVFMGNTSDGTANSYTQHYYWDHGNGGGSYFYNRDTIKAIYVGQYARVVLVDPSKTDDRHLSNFVIHVSSDIKASDGGMVPGYAMYGVGGISRYKKVPTNGDWMPVNFLGGLTQQELNSNPPPFITSPY